MIRKIISIVMAIIVAIVVYHLPITGINEEAQIMLAIFILIVILWLTEAVPLYAAAFLVPILTTVYGILTPAEALSPFFHPVIALLLGGFILSIAVHKHDLDKKFTVFILGLAGTRPRNIVFAVMGTTAFLSMWLSNTATTAIMIGIILPVARQIPPSNHFRKALVLSIPFAANIGGMGTPVGTTPNPIAISFLENQGTIVTFTDWMILAVPLQIIFLAIVVAVLWLFFHPWEAIESFKVEESSPFNRQKIWVIFVLLLTVLLWLTTSLHGVTASIIALVPIFLFSSTKMLNKEDYKEVGWDVLWLIGGGLALSYGVRESGLAYWLVEQISVGGIPPMLMLLVFVGFAALLTTFMSNTATAAILIPLAGAYGMQYGLSTQMVLGIALVSSAAMALPVSTPPNTIAYGSGEVSIKDMLTVGGTITVLCVIFVVILGKHWWQFLGYL